MATKSIYKDVFLRTKELSRNLVFALENAEKAHSKDVKLSKKVHDISSEDQIKRIFGQD